MKPSLAKGTRDFSSEEIMKRRQITGVLQRNFELFGFAPLETPSFENLSTLTGKYGEEGDRLIFKILNSGDYLEKISDEEMGLRNHKFLTPRISEKALRYDLTVPFARYVAMNSGQLPMPYKRYQIQPVWRADRPQKGRYREFYQCDADAVGSESLWQEVDFIQLYMKSFAELGVPVKIHINNRKILTGLAEMAGIPDQIIPFTVALDKLDKVGRDGVVKELLDKGIPQESIGKLDFLFENQGDSFTVLERLSAKLKDSGAGMKGISELSFVLHTCRDLGISENLVFDVTLARGLEYYTGAIFEVKAQGVEMGSIGGGGRYDSLTEVFGVKNMPGIGISFGLDRIYLVMEELQLFKDSKAHGVQYLFANYGETEALAATRIIAELRNKNIAAELYPDAGKLKKQFSYAEKKGIPEIVFIGEEEIKNQTITIKNIENGAQRTLAWADFISQDL